MTDKNLMGKKKFSYVKQSENKTIANAPDRKKRFKRSYTLETLRPQVFYSSQ
jgi:hypothetical protein